MSPFLFFIIAGAALIITEIVAFNLSFFWFLFIGIGALIAAFAAWLIPDAGWFLTSVIFVVASIGISLALYMPLRKWQKSPGKMQGNNSIGQTVEVLTEITADGQGEVKWSGATWQAKLADGSDPIAKGDQAVIESVAGIVLTVRKS